AAVGWISGGSCQVDSQAVTVAAATVAGSATLARQYQCRGARGSSEITRTRQSDGGETLRGETDVPFSPGSTGRLHLSESATVDGDFVTEGRLTERHLTLVCAEATQARGADHAPAVRGPLAAMSAVPLWADQPLSPAELIELLLDQLEALAQAGRLALEARLA